MRANPSNLTTGADAGRGVGEITNGPAGWESGPERHAISLSLSLSLSTYRRLELCLVEM